MLTTTYYIRHIYIFVIRDDIYSPINSECAFWQSLIYIRRTQSETCCAATMLSHIRTKADLRWHVWQPAHTYVGTCMYVHQSNATACTRKQRCMIDVTDRRLGGWRRVLQRRDISTLEIGQWPYALKLMYWSCLISPEPSKRRPNSSPVWLFRAMLCYTFEIAH